MRNRLTPPQVGDYVYDLAAGRAAGVATVHVDVGHGVWPELTDFRVTTLHDIREALVGPDPQ